jgi:hypothetical protein
MRKRGSTPICCLALIALFLAACSGGGATPEPPASASAAPATASPAPVPTATPPPTATGVPLPETLLADAGRLCTSQAPRGGEILPIEGISLETPVMTVFSQATTGEVWEYGAYTDIATGPGRTPHFDPIEAVTAGSVKTLVCIGESQDELIAHYSDGKPAVKLNWFVWLVRWPDGGLIASQFFWGDEPPATKSANGKPGFGAPPIAAVEAWLMSAVKP